jgi:ParB family chromosome partitioning protein
MNKKTALGRGFDGLIPTGFNVTDVAAPGEQIKQIEITKLFANPDQPRKTFDEKTLQELADSITQHGIIQPLVVTPHEGKFRIVAGERRFRASQLAGLVKIPVIVRDHKELEELEISLVENVQRVDLSPLETAVSVVRLRDQFSLTPKEISKKLGKAETTVSNIIRLLQLPKEAVEALQKNLITEGHARAILALKTDEKLQKELLNSIITQKLSVREAEAFVKEHRTEKNNTHDLAANIKKLVTDAEKNLTVSIAVKPKKRGGSVNIVYKNDEQLAAVLAQLQDN